MGDNGGRSARGIDPRRDSKPVALVVEDDTDERELVGAIFEESDVQVIECESAEAAMTVLELVGDRTVLVFADVKLAGIMDGVDLACKIDHRWPHARLVTTSDGCPAQRLRALPKRTRHMPKPWRALDLIIEVERAIAAR